MNLVFFHDALEHATRIHRVLRQERGHMLLIGDGGFGKQSLAKLADAAGCSVFEITLTRGYDENSFREDLKRLFTRVGVDNEKVVFLFTDNHVANESFLEHINSILTAAQFPRCTRMTKNMLLCDRSEMTLSKKTYAILKKNFGVFSSLARE